VSVGCSLRGAVDIYLPLVAAIDTRFACGITLTRFRIASRRNESFETTNLAGRRLDGVFQHAPVDCLKAGWFQCASFVAKVVLGFRLGVKVVRTVKDKRSEQRMLQVNTTTGRKHNRYHPIIQ
jgi:hypothetical protein